MPTPISDMELTSSLEDYLEAILERVEASDAGHAHVRDIARRLDVSMPAVTAALRTLAERGLVCYEPYKAVTLTDAGRRFAEDVARRHRVLKHFLTEVLALPAEAAEANACRIEHAAGPILLQRLADLAEYIQDAPPRQRSWVASFGERYAESGEDLA